MFLKQQTSARHTFVVGRVLGEDLFGVRSAHERNELSLITFAVKIRVG